MFDAKQIQSDIASQITHYFRRTLKIILNSSDLASLDDKAWQTAIQQNDEITRAIQLLVRVANHEIPGDLADDVLMGAVEEAIQLLSKVLFASPGNPLHYQIPPHFWQTDLGQVIRYCQLWLRGDDLISYTEAATILYPEEALQTARMRIKRMIERGELTPYCDPTENNPQRSARVSREEVESYL